MTAGKPLNIVILGLSITSSWGNGHATTFRGLVRELAARGHQVLFLERDVPWYAASRDLPNPEYCDTELYASLDDLKARFTDRCVKRFGNGGFLCAGRRNGRAVGNTKPPRA